MAEIQYNEQTQTQVAEISSPKVQQLEDSVGVAPGSEITFTSATQTIEVFNTHATQSLYLYLQTSYGGSYNTAKRTLRPGSSYAISARQSKIKLVGSGALTTYEIVALLE